MFREKLAELDMGLESRMKTKVGLLSGGQRQALSLLMSTIGNPLLLLLDEHTAALDPEAAKKIMEITQSVVKRQKLTTMMITHNIKAALETGTRHHHAGPRQDHIGHLRQGTRDMTVARLLELFSQRGGGELDNDRMLLTRS